MTLEMSVDDLDKAIDWWTNTVGFELAYRMDEMGWAEVNTATPGVSVGLNANGAGAGVGGATIVLGVTDIAAACAELEARGVAFPKGTEEIPGMVKLAEFTDPFGNVLTLAESWQG